MAHVASPRYGLRPQVREATNLRYAQQPHDQTLGVFGYYRASATGGDVAAKSDSDLVQPHEEFFYDQPGLFAVMPGRRVALLFSPAAFQLVFACPAIRNQVVRPLVFKREHGNWAAWVRSRRG